MSARIVMVDGQAGYHLSLAEYATLTAAAAQTAEQKASAVLLRELDEAERVIACLTTKVEDLSRALAAASEHPCEGTR